jgi:polyhydroxybutyrate depolymerase
MTDDRNRASGADGGHACAATSTDPLGSNARIGGPVTPVILAMAMLTVALAAAAGTFVLRTGAASAAHATDVGAHVTTAPPQPRPLPAGVRGTSVALSFQGLSRSYYVVAPATHPAGEALPLVVVLHGRGVSPQVEKDRTGFVPLVARRQAVLVFPAGVGTSWNGGACCGPAQARGIDDIDFVNEVVSHVVADEPVDPRRVYLVGYSNGGRLAFRMACQGATGRFAAVAVVAAAPTAPCPPGPATSLLALVAGGDPNVVYGSGKPLVVNGFTEPSLTAAMASWRERDGCPGTPAKEVRGTLTVLSATGCAAGTRVALGLYAHGGHPWPAGSSGTPSANDEVWSFFQRPTG